MDWSDLEDLSLDTDIAAQADRLDGAHGPAFALDSNRFHQQRKADIKAGRRGIKRLIKPENARCILPYLPGPDAHTHGILRGDFVLCDLIPAIISERGRCPSLYVATLGLSTQNAECLAKLKADGLIGDITVLCSLYFQQVDKATTYREVASILRDIGRLVVARNHAKIICLPTVSGDSFVIEGSANLRSSDNIEQITIFNSPELDAFHRSWIDDLAKGGLHA